MRTINRGFAAADACAHPPSMNARARLGWWVAFAAAGCARDARPAREPTRDVPTTDQGAGDASAADAGPTDVARTPVIGLQQACAEATRLVVGTTLAGESSWRGGTLADPT